MNSQHQLQQKRSIPKLQTGGKSGKSRYKALAENTMEGVVVPIGLALTCGPELLKRKKRLGVGVLKR